MNSDQRVQLVGSVDSWLQEHNLGKSTKTCKHTTDSVKWDEIPMPEGCTLAPDDLKNEYELVRKQCRAYRTYAEMLDDMKKEAKKIKPKRKKPASSFSMFYSAMFKQLKEENPTATQKEIMKITGERWSNLSDKKRDKWERAYEEAKEEYDAVMQEMQKREDGPDFPMKPIQIYIEKYLEDQEGEDVDDNVKRLKEKFHTLKQTKRLSYIKQSMFRLKEYRENVKAFMVDRPNFQDKVKYKAKSYPLSIKEFNLWRVNHLDAPPQPQATARDQYAADEDLTPREASDMWSCMNHKERKMLNQRHKDAMSKYSSEYDAWFLELAPWQQQELTRCGYGLKGDHTTPVKNEADSTDEITAVIKKSTSSDDEVAPPSPKRKKKKHKNKIEQE